jgi:hypothetical protein
LHAAVRRCPGRAKLAANCWRGCLAAEWLGTGVLQKVVLVITGVASKEVLERWTFDIQTDKAVMGGG